MKLEGHISGSNIFLYCTGQSLTSMGESSTSRKKGEFQTHGVRANSRKADVLPPGSVEDTKETPNNSDTRPKEGLKY